MRDEPLSSSPFRIPAGNAGITSHRLSPHPPQRKSGRKAAEYGDGREGCQFAAATAVAANARASARDYIRGAVAALAISVVIAGSRTLLKAPVQSKCEQ